MVMSKNALLPISNCTSRNLLRSLGAKNKDLGFALQMLLDRDTLNLQQRLKRLNGDGGVKKKGGIIISITVNRTVLGRKKVYLVD